MRNSATHAPARANDGGENQNDEKDESVQIDETQPEEGAKAVAANFPRTHAAIAAAGAAAERTRIANIGKLAEPGEEALTASYVEKGMSVADAALAFADDRKAKRQASANNRRADAPPPVDNAPAGEAASAPKEGQPATDDQLKAAYAASPDLQATYGSEARYLGFMKAAAAGSVNLISKPKT